MGNLRVCVKTKETVQKSFSRMGFLENNVLKMFDGQNPHWSYYSSTFYCYYSFANEH